MKVSQRRRHVGESLPAQPPSWTVEGSQRARQRQRNLPGETRSVSHHVSSRRPCRSSQACRRQPSDPTGDGRSGEPGNDAGSVGRNLERALDIDEAAYGLRHPDTVATLGLVQLEQSERPAAHATLEEALAVSEGMLRAEHPAVAMALSASAPSTGAGRAGGGRRDAGAGGGHQPRLRTGSSEVGVALADPGMLRWRQGRATEARATLDRAFAILEGSYGPDHPHTARVLELLRVSEKEFGCP